ncbi:MAG: helix-turn-helix transcriptional regulator [Anaerolineae bacterium]|nr:helix-turn-helix transcriptional regulator [Anaerolineae bacterium]
MTDDDKLRRALKQRLQAQRDQPQASQGDVSAAKRFGSFLSALCRDKGWSAQDLALKLNIEEALAQAILNGFLPRSQIDDDFLLDISQVVGCDFEVLKQTLEPNADG